MKECSKKHMNFFLHALRNVGKNVILVAIIIIQNAKIRIKTKFCLFYLFTSLFTKKLFFLFSKKV